MTPPPRVAAPIPASYVLPLRAAEPLDVDAITYVRGLTNLVEDVIVVDGSAPAIVERHAALFGDVARVLRPDPDRAARNGKVAGVLTGVAIARHEPIVVADDDVRYGPAELREVVARLEDFDAVVPQNVFVPAPWHARWDTARSLVHRAVGHDMGGTIAVRRSRLLAAGGYEGDVLFENLELLRTIEAAGGTVHAARDVFVERRPPSARHFVGQRVRQAYDEFARPWYLAAWLSILPVAAWTLRRPGRRPVRDLTIGATAAVLVAEAGRRRDDGAEVFPRTASLWAPAWVLERAVCAWLAVGARLRGGVRYRGAVISRAATPRRHLRAAPAMTGVAT